MARNNEKKLALRPFDYTVVEYDEWFVEYGMGLFDYFLLNFLVHGVRLSRCFLAVTSIVIVYFHWLHVI